MRSDRGRVSWSYLCLTSLGTSKIILLFMREVLSISELINILIDKTSLMNNKIIFMREVLSVSKLINILSHHKYVSSMY